MDVYFSADVETDGPIPGPYSMLSFALVPAGRLIEGVFERASRDAGSFYRELQPISSKFEADALAINGLDRARLAAEGASPQEAMTQAADWVRQVAGNGRPILVAYPLSFDWTWLYWYFTQYSTSGSPFNHSGCFDIKTAFAVKSGRSISNSGRSQLIADLRPKEAHSHHALEDAIEQAEIFAKLIEWEGFDGVHPKPSE